MNNTYYQRNEKRFLEKAEIVIMMKVIKKKLKDIMKVIKKGCESKRK